MLHIIKNDPIVKFLGERSSLTHTQLDTILASSANGSLKQKVSFRDKRGLSEGAFVRSLRQGQRNIEGCMYTLILLEYLSLVKQEDLDKLSRLGVLISKIRESSPTWDEVLRLIQGVQELAETLSGRRKLIV